MKIKMSKISVIIAAVFVSVLGVSLASKPTYAETADIVQKWVMAGWHDCITGQALNSSIDRGSVVNANIPDTVVQNRYYFVPVPNFKYFSDNSGQINCAEVLKGGFGLFGGQRISGILELAGLNGDTTFAQLNDSNALMKKLGYDSYVEQGEGEVTSFNIKVGMTTTTERLDGENSNTTEGDERSATIVATDNGDGTKQYTRANSNLFNFFKVSFKNQNIVIDFEDENYKTGAAGVLAGAVCSTSGSSDQIKFTISVPLSNNVATTTRAIRDALRAKGTWTTKCDYVNQRLAYIYSYSFDIEDIVDSTTINRWKIDQNENTAKSSMAQLGRNYTSTALNGTERFNLYKYYLEQELSNLNSQKHCSPASGLSEIHMQSSGGNMIKYYMDLSSLDLTKKYWDIKINSGDRMIQQVTMQEIIDYFNSFPASDAPEGECPDIDNAAPIENTTNEETGSGSTCWSSSSALGWILCPTIEATANAVEGLYGNIVEPFLEIKASTFDTDSGVYQGWQTFQTIANVIFVILFLVTILSQITGFGIDNFGVKRILPKLIVAAILVNLSYIICQLLVDVSNIVGYGANHFFDNIQIDATNTVSTGQAAITTLLSALGLGSGIGIAAATSPIWAPAMVIPILLVLVSLLISLIFAFILLGVRQAGVIILVLLAPIAFVLYMLPNTKPIFDKWKKAFIGLLLLYPICGLLMGGAKFVGEVLTKTSDSFWVAAIGALLSVVVFFFIPTLVRSSMSAMGNVGARISNLRQAASRGATQRLGNTQIAQDYRKRVAAGVDRDGNITARGRMMSRIASGESRFSRVPGLQRIASQSMARGRAAFLADRAQQNKEEKLNQPDYLTSAMAEQDSRAIAEQVATEQANIESSTEFMTGDYDRIAQDMVELMRSDEGGENTAKIKAYQNALNKIGDDGRTAMSGALRGLDFGSISNNARQAWANNLLSEHGPEFKNNARSMYEAAKANVGATASGNFNDFIPGAIRGTSVSSYKPEQLANMDDGEFDMLMQNYNTLLNEKNNGTLTADGEKRFNELQRLAYAARTDSRLKGSLKGTRREGLETMSAGYVPPRNAPTGATGGNATGNTGGNAGNTNGGNAGANANGNAGGNTNTNGGAGTNANNNGNAAPGQTFNVNNSNNNNGGNGFSGGAGV